MVRSRRKCGRCRSATLKIEHSNRVTEYRCVQPSCGWSEASVRCRSCAVRFDHARDSSSNGRFPVQCPLCRAGRNAAYQRSHREVIAWVRRWLASANGTDGPFKLNRKAQRHMTVFRIELASGKFEPVCLVRRRENGVVKYGALVPVGSRWSPVQRVAYGSIPPLLVTHKE